LNLPLKLGPTKRTLLASFFSRFLKSIWIEYVFPYAMLPHHKWAKRNTIKITRKTNVGLPHHKGPMPAYPMKKKRHLYITS
jgi:hypothetical protein